MGKIILVIDDDSAILESLEFLLVDEGYEVMTSQDGRIVDSGLGDKRPDLILLDYWLPKQNGGEITKKLKKNASTSSIPVIIISASYNIKETVKKAGADDFVTKPYDADYILQRIAKFI